MKNIRSKFENEIRNITEEQKKLRSEYVESVKTNEAQNDRIKVLEIQEKVQSLINGKNYLRALEYISPGLELDPKNITLLSQKSHCHSHLQDFTQAIKCNEEIIAIDNSNGGAISNLLELYILQNQFDKFEKLYHENKLFIDGRENGSLITFYNVLIQCMKNDSEKMTTYIHSYLSEIDTDKKQRLKWTYDESLSIVNKISDEKIKEIFRNFVNFLSGNLNKDELSKTMA